MLTVTAARVGRGCRRSEGARLVHAEVKHLDVAVVVAREHAALLVVERVAKRHGPAVPVRAPHALTCISSSNKSPLLWYRTARNDEWRQHTPRRMHQPVRDEKAPCAALGARVCLRRHQAGRRDVASVHTRARTPHLMFSASDGSNAATGAPSCRTSQTRTHPSRPHVTSSGAP